MPPYRSTAARLCGALAVLCSVQACGATASRVFDEGAVYAALVDSLRARSAGDAVLLLEPRRAGVDLAGPLRESMPSEAVARAFAEANRDSTRLTPGEAALLSLELLDRERLPPTNGGLAGWWQEVRSHYGGRPVTIVSLSRPGFSESGRVAAIYYGTTCGGRCGHTVLAVLEILDGRWTVRSERVMLVY